MLREEIIFKDNFENVVSCFFCHKSTHLPQNCPTFHFVPDREFHIKKFNYSSLQIRKPFPRKIRKSCHALKNNDEIEENVVNISTSLYMHYLDQLPEGESQLEIEDLPSLASPGPRRLSKKQSLSAVSEDSSLDEDEEEKKNVEREEELERKTVERARQVKPTKIINVKASNSHFSFNDLQESDSVIFKFQRL